MSNFNALEPRKKRIRLSPEVRKQQILDAALVEFSEHGFGAATVEQIAKRVGLSKAGLYAHFKSKDEIFETLVTRVLSPSWTADEWKTRENQPLKQTVDAFIDNAYARITDPSLTAVLRLLISESGRAPEIVRHWKQAIIQPYFDTQQHTIDNYVEQGLVRPSALTKHFALALTPILFAAVWGMIFAESDTSEEIEAMREAHRTVLIELLTIG